eukprot:TRINITY_DN1209_c1_g1_i1.p1 TRINITY_DN1209_c1_g1~~TRINITY_DN1209_c1_g1_i1.p1  ORF type:complete len:310 (+),score=94.38 TRINITY_DN1209_c1_g1_i1:59-931(+)
MSAVTEIRVLPNGEIVLKQQSTAASGSVAAPLSIEASPAAASASPSPCTPLTELGVKLVVFDMAGTTVDEGGIVYTTLKAVMKEAGLKVDDDEFNAWHGANKREVIAHFVAKNNAGGEEEINGLYADFEEELVAVYFDKDSPLKPIPGITKYFTKLRKAGIKIGLDTGFPRNIASHIIKKLGFGSYIDGSCVAMEVGQGRPYPFMIYELMKQCGIEKIQQVAKMGDTVRDIEEGLNAGTPYVYGCLTGADNRETLVKAGAFSVVNSVTDVPITSGKRPAEQQNGVPKKRN